MKLRPNQIGLFKGKHPDSLILATAKVTGSALVSLDRELLETAKLEGVQSFLPRNFVRWW